jgi:hypothetical protein
VLISTQEVSPVSIFGAAVTCATTGWFVSQYAIDAVNKTSIAGASILFIFCSPLINQTI